MVLGGCGWVLNELVVVEVVMVGLWVVGVAGGVVGGLWWVAPVVWRLLMLLKGCFWPCVEEVEVWGCLGALYAGYWGIVLATDLL